MHIMKNGVAGKKAACSGMRIKRLRRNMTCKEYRKAIAKNLKGLKTKDELELVFKYSKILADWSNASLSDLYRSCIIFRLFGDHITAEHLGAIDAFTVAIQNIEEVKA